MTTIYITLGVIGAAMFFGALAACMLSSTEAECEETGRGMMQ